MIILDSHNKIIEETLLEKYNNPDTAAGKFESVEMVLADFDGVLFHLATGGESAKNLLTISVSIKCWAELAKCGVDNIMKEHYGSSIIAPESGYSFSIMLDLSKPPADIPKYVRDVAMMKRHAMAAPFYKAFADVESKTAGSLVEIPYRDDEALYLKSENDRVIVIFSVAFKDQDDVVVAKTFLQEYQDARRTMGNAPAVSYAQKEPPMELKGAKFIPTGQSNGFVSFVLFGAHIKKRDSTIDTIIQFRNYLHYHIKCSKAFMHTRMRNRVRTFLQVLNRAKQEPLTTEKKTMGGKTFRRPDDPTPADQEFNI